MRITAVSLFAGVGGIDLALSRAGMDVRAAVEIDDDARGVLAHRLPETTLYRDVTEVTADDLRAAGFVPERGIVAAGWPCQGNSVAGARGGMDDARSGLWAHVVRLLDETRAAWFLGENVPGLLSVNGGEDFGIVLSDLADLGMDVCWRVLDSQHFGVPQRRERVFLVGHLGDDRGPVRVLLEPEGGSRDPASRRTPGARVAATLTAGASRGGVSAPGRRSEGDVNLVVSSLTANGVGTCGADDNQAQAGHLVATYQKVVRSGARDADGGLPPDVWAERATAATLSPFDLGSDTRAVELVVAPALTARCGSTLDDQQTGQLVTVTGPVTHALTSEGADASEDGTGRGTPLASDGVTVRRLTPMECERLQGFPDDWTAERVQQTGKRAGQVVRQADSPRYRQMGNAVAVPCVEWIARRIVIEHARQEAA